MSKITPGRFLTVLILTLAATGFSHGQHNQPQLPSLSPPTPGRRPAEDDAATRAAAERQLNLRNEERQKRLIADTDKLLALATSLHEDVAKTNKNVLSLDVIKRADEIERLAHAVKERMRN